MTETNITVQVAQAKMNHNKVYWAKEGDGLVEVFQVAHIPVLAAVALGTRTGAGLDGCTDVRR